MHQVEQAPQGGLLDEMVEDPVTDVLEVGEEAIDRVSRRRSIEATAEPDNGVVQFSCNQADAVDILVITMQKATHHLERFKISFSPRFRRGEHVESFEKLEGKMFEQRQSLWFHGIEERCYRRIIL